MPKFKTLVIGGDYGAFYTMEGILQLGAVLYLESQQLLPNIQTFYGSSTGSITAALLALRFPTLSIVSFMIQYNKSKHFLTHSALKYELTEFINRTLPSHAHITFHQVLQAFNTKLCITLLNMKTKSVDCISVDTHPNVPIVDVVMAAVCHPFFSCPSSTACMIQQKMSVDLYQSNDQCLVKPTSESDSQETLNPNRVSSTMWDVFVDSCFILNSAYSHVPDKENCIGIEINPCLMTEALDIHDTITSNATNTTKSNLHNDTQLAQVNVNWPYYLATLFHAHFTTQSTSTSNKLVSLTLDQNVTSNYIINPTRRIPNISETTTFRLLCSGANQIASVLTIDL